MGYSVVLSIPGGQSYTFAIPPNVDYDLLNNVGSDGKLVSSEVVVPLHGFLTGSGPADTFQKWLDLLNFSMIGKPLDFVLLRDNVAVQRFNADDSIGSPFIRNLSTVPQGGSLVNMVEFTLEVIIRRASTDQDKPGAGKSGLIRQSTTEWYNNRLQRKTWHVRVSGTGARQFLLAMKPPLKPIYVSEVRDLAENTHEIEYAFDQVQTDDFLRWDETVDINVGGSPIFPAYRTDGQVPILEIGQLREAIVTVTGRITSINRGITLPGRLLSIDNLDGPMSMVSPILVEDGVKGTYFRTYTDVFKFESVAGAIAALVNPRPPVRTEDYPNAIPDSRAPGFEG